MNSAGSPPVTTAAPIHAIAASDPAGELSQAEAGLLTVLRIYCEAAAIAVVIVGLIALYGWTLGIGWMKYVVPGLVEMKANTAFGLIFAGWSCWLLLPEEPGTRRRKAAQILAFLVILIAALTGAEYLTGWNLHIDELIFRESPYAVAASSPGRMAPATVVAFLGIGAALLLIDREPWPRVRPAQWLSMLVALIA